MTGRFLAICGWVAWQAGRPVRATRLRRAWRTGVLALALVLVGLAALPLVIPLFDPQPRDVAVQEIFDGEVHEPSAWVRLRGRVVPLADAPTEQAGRYALLVDEADTLRAIVLRTGSRPEASESTTLTGRLTAAIVLLEEQLPIEATVAGTPPRVVPDRLVEVDPTPKPQREVWWQLSILPVLLAGVLLLGARTGYPFFRATNEIDVLAGPLAPGERLPAAFGGRVGAVERDLADPGGALLLVRRGPKGALLTAQPLADDGGTAPPPVTIGGSWTSGRLGYVHTVTESVPALVIRSELVDATFLFARTTERDRVAALIAVER